MSSHRGSKLENTTRCEARAGAARSWRCEGSPATELISVILRVFRFGELQPDAAAGHQGVQVHILPLSDQFIVINSHIAITRITLIIYQETV